MNYSPAQIVRQLLQDASLIDESASWESFVSFFPERPHEALCFYDTTGIDDGRMMRSGERIEHDGVQIRLRGRTYNSAWVRATAICRYLDAQANVVVDMDSDDSYLIYNMSRTSTLQHLGVDPDDDARRHQFSINLAVSLYKGAFSDLPGTSVSVSQATNEVGTGSPEGVVSAAPGSTYLDTDADSLWMKDTGTGNTGWIQLIV